MYSEEVKIQSRPIWQKRGGTFRSRMCGYEGIFTTEGYGIVLLLKAGRESLLLKRSESLLLNYFDLRDAVFECRLRLATCDSETCGLQGVSLPQARQTQPRGFGRRIHSSVEVTELVPINDTLSPYIPPLTEHLSWGSISAQNGLPGSCQGLRQHQKTR